MNKILVTGADGFIGSHLVEMLVREGYEVKAMVRYTSRQDFQNLSLLPNDVLDCINVLKADIVDPFAVRDAVSGCDAVLHLAALIGIPYSYVAPASYIDVNVKGTLNVLEASRRYDVDRVVHTSTSETYGSAQYTPMDESHPAVGQSPYSASKIAADQLVESYWRSFSLPATIIRPFNTYGPRQSSRAIIPTIISQLQHKGKLELGSLSPVRDLTFVEDTAAGFIAALRSESALGSTINLGVGKGISIGELVEKVCELLGVTAQVTSKAERVRPEKSEVERLISDNSLAKQLLGWQPRVSLTDGLVKTIDFVKKNPQRFDADNYSV